MKTYLMIENDVVVNTCIWDGNNTTWTPPNNVTMLEQESTQTKIWDLKNKEFILVDSIGDARIGFTYEKGVCVTNEPKPEYKEPDGEIPTTTV